MRRLRWAGSDLGPLPFESTFSVLLRFGWRNALNANQLKLFCHRAGRGSVPPFHLDLSWIDRRSFQSDLEWKVPSEEELSFIQGIRGDHELWLSDVIRFCPLCLEHGYHSYLHQLSGVKQCPLHRIPLQDHCYQCNWSIRYCFSSAIYDRPYACPKCGGAFCGVTPNLTLHLMLRDQGKEIEEAFAPIMNWWESSRETRAEVAPSWDRLAARDPMQNGWCNVSEFLRSMVLRKVSAPASMSAPAYKDITILRWKVYPGPDGADRLVWRRRRNWAMRVSIPASVYRALLRRLVRWVDKHDSLSNRHINLGAKNVADFPPRSLALLCFRSEFEGKWSLRDWNTIEYGKVTLRDEPFFEIVSYCNRTPRLAWRAFFLASYASWYFKVRHARNDKTSELKFSHNSERRSVMADQNIWVSPTDPWYGWVAFPSIEFFDELLTQRSPSEPFPERPSEHAETSLRRNSGMTQTATVVQVATVNKDQLLTDYALILEFIKTLAISHPDVSATPLANEPAGGVLGRKEMSTTQRGYLSTLDRYFVWCAVRHSKSVLSMTTDECNEYEHFLQDPQSRRFWSSAAGRHEWGEQWRPMKRPLSPRSTVHALSVIRQMYKFLCSQGYISFCPVINATQAPMKPAPINMSQRLPLSDFGLVWSEAERLPNTPTSRRQQFVLSLILDTGMRMSELVTLRLKDLRRVRHADSQDPEPSNGSWYLEINAPRRRVRTIPISTRTIFYLQRHLVSRGLPLPLNRADLQEVFLIGPLMGGADTGNPAEDASTDSMAFGVEAETIRKEVKRFLSLCARNVEPLNPPLAKILAHAGTRWLHKMYIFTSLEAGASVVDVSNMSGISAGAISEYQLTDQGSSSDEKIALAAARFYGRLDDQDASA